jgi:hypothetical protein
MSEERLTPEQVTGLVDAAQNGAAHVADLAILRLCIEVRKSWAERDSLRARVAALEQRVQELEGQRGERKGIPARCADCGIPAPEGAHVLCIVNGEDVAVVAQEGELLSQIRGRALEQTKNTGRPPEEWEIRSARGWLLSPQLRLAPEHYRGRHLRIDDDNRLFLLLRVGFGG